MNATLFGVPASHPSLAAELMLRHKRIGYRRIDLVSAAHGLLVPALGFPGRTVPALRLGAARLQGTTQIALALDALRPEPSLFPHDPERRRAVEQADELETAGSTSRSAAADLERPHARPLHDRHLPRGRPHRDPAADRPAHGQAGDRRRAPLQPRQRRGRPARPRLPP